MARTTTLAGPAVAAGEGELRRAERRRHLRRDVAPVLATVGPVTLWLCAFVAIPLVYVLVMSFCQVDQYYNVQFAFSLENYRTLLDVEYLKICLRSVLIALAATAACLAVGYPFAYLISRTFSGRKTLLYMLVIIPFWTNSLVRLYGWRVFLSATGALNGLLGALGVPGAPFDFLYNQGATVFGMAYDMFPFMVLPLYSAIEHLPQSQIDASHDLGAGLVATLVRVVIPQTTSGIFSGCMMVFIPSLGAFYISDILGGGNADVIGNLIQRQFGSANNWPLGAALSIVLMLVALGLVRLYRKVGGDMESLGV